LKPFCRRRKDAGYRAGKQVFLALDVASSEFLRRPRAATMSSKKALAAKFGGQNWWIFTVNGQPLSIVSIEDGCAEMMELWKTGEIHFQRKIGFATPRRSSNFMSVRIVMLPGFSQFVAHFPARSRLRCARWDNG